VEVGVIEVLRLVEMAQGLEDPILHPILVLYPNPLVEALSTRSSTQLHETT